MNTLKVGDVVAWRGGFGRNAARPARVVRIELMDEPSQKEDGRLVDVLRKRVLHEDAIDRRIGVQAANHGIRLILSGRAGHAEGLGLDPNPGTGTLLHADIGLRCRVIAGEDRNQLGRSVARRNQRGYAILDLSANRPREGGSVQ